MLREKEKGLSTGERKMLASAKQIFISELIAKNITQKNREYNMQIFKRLITCI